MRIRADDGPLLARASRALGWSVASTAIGKLSTVAIGVVLARLLGPAQFGTFAIAMVALLAILSFNELGVSLAIVRWPGEPEEIAPTVATLSIISSLVVYVGCYIGAPAFSELMGQPDATPVVRLLCLCVLVSGVAAVPVALLQRSFRQDRKMVADQVSTWVGALVSIGCALAGLGAMSLAVGQLTGSIAASALFIRFAPAGIRLGFNSEKARSLLRFGLPLAGSSIIVFAVGNVDRLIVGAVLGPVSLGVYVLAVNLSNWPLAVFSQPVRAVAPAALARLQHDPKGMRSTFLAAACLLSAVTLPICALLAGAAKPVIHVVYGSAWTAAASVLPWLAALAALRILFELFYDFFVVLSRTRVVLTAQVLWLVVLVPAVLIGTRAAGAAGGAAAQVAVALLVVLPIYLVELHRADVYARAVVSRVAHPVAVSAAVGTAAWLVSRWTVDLVALAVAGVLGVAAVGLLLYRERDAIRLVRGGRADPVAPGSSPRTPALREYSA